MNKQVVSFLSLFSLVLVLSIYYVMIPSFSSTTLVDDQISENGSDVSISNASNLFFSSLEENRRLRHEEVKNTQIDILASAEYSNEEKLEAKNKLTYEELIEDTEIGLENAMTELNFNDIFIEKLDSYFYVTAYDSTMVSDQDLNKVLQIADVFNEYFENNEADDLNTYNPIVNFVSF